MKVLVLKRDHHEGQTIYGLFSDKSAMYKGIKELIESGCIRYIKKDLVYLEVNLNEAVEIEAYDEGNVSNIDWSDYDSFWR